MANLIGFDKNRDNIEFKGHSKLSINFMSDYLYVEPQNEEFKLISSSFKWNYVMKKNLMFVFAEFNFLDFCLEFRNEQICKKTFDYINTGNKDAAITDTISINTSFLKPIFQKISDNPPSNSSLINVIVKWHQILDEEEKEKYSNLMKEYGIFDTISAAIQKKESNQRERKILEERNNRKRRFSQIKKEEIAQDEMDRKTTLQPSSHFRLIRIRNSYNRTLLVFTSDQMDSFHQFKSMMASSDNFKCIKCEKKAIIDVNKNGEICVKMDSIEHSCKPSKKIPENSTNIKLIQKPNYEFFDNCSNKFVKIIVVFDSDDRNLCYEYSCFNGASKFSCRGCLRKKIAPSDIPKANIRNEGTEKEYVGCFGEHHCEKRKYSPEKYRQYFDYVLKPDFEIRKYYRRDGKESRKLIIYDADDRSKYYQYYYFSSGKKFACCECLKSKKWVTAMLNQNSEDVEYIILSNVKHVCEMRSSVSLEKIVLYQPQDFEIMGELKNPKIFVFEKNDRKAGYVFYTKDSSYSCLGCDSGSIYRKNGKKLSVVHGRLLKSEKTGQYSFQMKVNQTHSCKTRPYQPEKYYVIPKTFDFFYYRLKNQSTTVKLAIKSLENDQLCYTFVYEKFKNCFICIECRRMKKKYSVKVQKDADGKEYFNHDLKKHICKPIKVSSIPKSDMLKESGIAYESKPKIDESRIIESANFQLQPNKNGVAERKLIIFCSNDKILCYEFSFNTSKQNFLCNKCLAKKTWVSAKLHKNDEENGDETFIVMGKKEHVCQPVKYRPK